MSEYLPYIRTDQERIDRYVVESGGPPDRGGVKWMPTGGYLEHWLANQREARRLDVAEMDLGIRRSEEYGARLIHSMETGTPRRMDINVSNRTGVIGNLPDESCVEVPCLVDGTGVHPCAVGELPPQLAALNRTNVNVQALGVRAALDRDEAALRQAIKLDPLTGAALGLDEIDEMIDELLAANDEYLPDLT